MINRALFSRKPKIPIVFVPGLFGSMSDVILPGTGNWHFGLAGIVYQPFIKMLERMGYKEGEDLFIAYYDWRKPIESNAKHYLLPVIEEAKGKTASKKVNIISHSMGGLVSRAYVQSKLYHNDVDQLIMIATPNAGSAPNFSFWTGGEMPDTDDTSVNLVHIYMKVYLWLLSQLHPQNPIEAIHSHFPSLGDIVPSRLYENYIIEHSYSNIMQWKPYSKLKTKNPFLDHLNEKQYTLSERGIRLCIIAGIGISTVQRLEVTKDKKHDKQWVDGRVVRTIKTESGDGNATASSVCILKGDQYILPGTHNEILLKSESILRKKLWTDRNEGEDYSSLTWNEYIVLCWSGEGELLIQKDDSCEVTVYQDNIVYGFGYAFILGKSMSGIKVYYHANQDSELKCRVSRFKVEDFMIHRRLNKKEQIQII
ncbi:acetyltransferase [Pontibacillus sp. HMF3514]|nr:acetyltransferase [Pontibacillus sp. HMF3514]